MNPSLYSQYHRVYDIFSIPQVFPILLRFCQQIVELAPKNTNQIADIGCGTGLFTQYLQTKFPQATFDVVDPSEHMLPYAMKRLNQEQTHIFHGTFDEAYNQLSAQDIFVFQRSLYGFYPDIDTYCQLAEKVYDKTNTGGLVAIYEIAQIHNIPELKEYLLSKREHLPIPQGEWEAHWSILKTALEDFNTGIQEGRYTLLDKQKRKDIFVSAGFTLIRENDNLSFFRKEG